MTQRKIFIDGGGNNGCSVRYFKKEIDIVNEYEVYSFEPNLEFTEIYENLIEQYSIKYFPCALSTYDGEITFYKNLSNSSANTTNEIKGKKRGVGSGVSGKVEIEKVKCIDLGNFIKNNFSISDYIHLKLDVECAEYDILNKMLDDGSIDYVNKLSIEWHNNKCGVNPQVDKVLEKAIKAKKIVINNAWNALGY